MEPKEPKATFRHLHDPGEQEADAGADRRDG
jgi:hypothetical protein